jgi:hypothetical protein
MRAFRETQFLFIAQAISAATMLPWDDGAFCDCEIRAYNQVSAKSSSDELNFAFERI